jgi:hypothetical protein
MLAEVIFLFASVRKCHTLLASDVHAICFAEQLQIFENEMTEKYIQQLISKMGEVSPEGGLAEGALPQPPTPTPQAPSSGGLVRVPPPPLEKNVCLG